MGPRALCLCIRGQKGFSFIHSCMSHLMNLTRYLFAYYVLIVELLMGFLLYYILPTVLWLCFQLCHMYMKQLKSFLNFFFSPIWHRGSLGHHAFKPTSHFLANSSQVKACTQCIEPPLPAI